MAEQDVKREVQALRAELEALSRRLDESPTPPGDASGRAGEVPAEPGGGLRLPKDLLEDIDARQLSKHVAKFLESLGRDVKDSRPKALVAAFVAGFVAGRVVGR